MKKLSILITLCILAVGIAASANIHTSETDGVDISKVQHISSKASNTSTDTTSSDPKTIVFLLGVGIVGLVTFSRMNSPKSRKHIDRSETNV